MATGRERRNERLNERLRGAQRTNIEDDSFHLDIAGLNIASSNSPALSTSRPTPNTSVKRKRLESDEAPPPQSQPTPSEARRSIREELPRDPYELPDTSKESIPQPATGGEAPVGEQEEEEPEPEPEPEPELPPQTATNSQAGPPEPGSEPEEEEVLDTLPDQLPDLRRASRNTVDEIEESPQDAPGSGKRVVQMSGALSSTTRLRHALSTDDIGPPSSSPLAQKVRRRSSVAASARSRLSSRRSSQMTEDDEVDELSPVQARDRSAIGHESELAPVEEEPAEEVEEELGEDGIEQRPQEPEADDEATEEEPEAEEISAIEAAKTIGRKRPRASSQPQSPELGSAGFKEPGAEEPVEEPVEETTEEPAPKRIRGQRQRPAKSPAAQKQPAPKPRTKPAARRPEPKSKTKAKPRAKAAGKGRRTSHQGEGEGEGAEDDRAAIEITVQRFVNVKRHAQGEDDIDPLHSEIPFSTRGETVVDVFAQVCTEVIDSTIAQLHEAMSKTEDKAQKKEARVKIRAVESYREELNSRMLQHAIHLNDWHSLRKRVRVAQREKLSLREEILRLKREREQVALRMDAVRIKHEEDSNESKYRLDASSTMHDVDLTIERGRDAPELSRAEQKQAELANLELLVAQISDEASSNSARGGMLQQVKDFNAFLERAAVALESR